MIKLTPKYARSEPLYTIDILRKVSEALVAVLGSGDDELLNAGDVREGFMHVAAAVSSSLTDLEEVVAERLQALRTAEQQELVLKAELATVESAYAYLEAKYYATPGHTPLDLSEAAALFAKRREGKAPDLTEPAEPAAGITAAKAG